MEKAAGNDPQILADDILLLTWGKKMLHRFARGLKATHIYLEDMGAKVAPDKNYNFASTVTARNWLRKTYWRTIKTSITVVEKSDILVHI